MFDFLSQKFSSILSHFSGKKAISETNIQEALLSVHDALLEADVPASIVTAFIDEVKKEAIGSKVVTSLKPGDQFIKIIHEKLKSFLGGYNAVEFSFQLPATVMVMGLQGAGKTTAIAKMAHWTQEQAKKRGKKRNILVASVDFYRPAAIDQLEILSKTVGCGFYRPTETDPVKAARAIQDFAKRESYELLFLDTAGRLHIDTAMVEQLQLIDRALAPRYKMLVLDSMIGQESLHVAQAFNDAVGYTHAILTKMDSDTRAGVAFAFRYAQKKPILFVGTGEKIEDLDYFHPDRVAGRILGMGDVLSLIEKAEQAVDKKEQEQAYESFMKGQFTLQDFASQLSMVSKLGSLTTLARYLPGMPGMTLSPEQLEKGEQELKKFKAIMNSMTPRERLQAHIIDQSRKKRIARGAGVVVGDVTLLLERFEQSRQYAKLFKKLGRNNGLFK